MSMDKRARSPTGSSQALLKRARVEEEGVQSLVVSHDGKSKHALIQQIKRTSALPAPIVALSGAHTGEILDCTFHRNGQILASACMNKSIDLWNVYSDNSNFGTIRGTFGPVTSVAFSAAANTIHASSADRNAYSFDLKTGQAVRKHKGHRAIVNQVDLTRGGREMMATASDDGTVKIWDADMKDAFDQVDLGYPITAIKWSEDGQQLFVGGVDNDIHTFDLRTKTIAYTLRGHRDTVTGLALSPSGTHLLSTAMDDTVMIWNVQPFAPVQQDSAQSNPRLHRVLRGAPSGFEGWLRRPDWDSTGTMVAAGGADRAVTVWNVETSEVLYKLGGHTGYVTSVAMHPKEPILLSGATDKMLYLGEIEPGKR